MNNQTFIGRHGAIYIFILIIAYVASAIYNNLGSSYVTENLSNNLHYAVATVEDSSQLSVICSVKNTGYNTIRGIKILLWSIKSNFTTVDFDTTTLQMISSEDKNNFIHKVFELKGNVYPSETKTFKFILKKVSDKESEAVETKDDVKVRIYSANMPAILTSQITEKTSFHIGPYLMDLLWIIAWTYISIGLLVVLPLAIFIYLIFYLLTRLFKIGTF